ncbi:flagellar hook assembly protein FlgD [Bacillus sp. T33-2]|uniref:flagellar hook assembly protein FlgD n=1 Tax=Bacillus sp. T33-2 TaxID=2054168 RepID=UPI000C7859DD|nr:flagellar hook assembly protein FlgD [Bacillus sp. T33-2]PLR97271.1 flagellar hook assembly protein FlgD [Bacillus sp. T33-2]
MANTIDSSYLLTNYQKERKTGSDILGKDDFLKILMTQLKNQDPLNPMQDKDFVAQMATFSTLEQITNMGSSIEKLVKVQEQNNLTTYTPFVGKEVTWHTISQPEDGSGKPVITEGAGKVASIQFNDGNVKFILEDGTELEPGNISQINDSPGQNQILQASMLIGRTISYLDSEKNEKTAAVLSVSFKNGKTEFQLNDEHKTAIGPAQIIKIQ